MNVQKFIIKIACELKKRGVEAKIYQYPTSASSNHRSVKYKNSTGTWSRFPYRKYDIAQSFRDTDSINQGTEIDTTC